MAELCNLEQDSMGKQYFRASESAKWLSLETDWRQRNQVVRKLQAQGYKGSNCENGKS